MKTRILCYVSLSLFILLSLCGCAGQQEASSPPVTSDASPVTQPGTSSIQAPPTYPRDFPFIEGGQLADTDLAVQDVSYGSSNPTVLAYFRSKDEIASDLKRRLIGLGWIVITETDPANSPLQEVIRITASSGNRRVISSIYEAGGQTYLQVTDTTK